ncbi:hypothetical protein GA0070616_4607 [Micromonospora nigra]|uniref:Uncharacterized protein n=1 Tax=Micromonospora nigra TaxID=145857 RepID=A0A1C6STZ7_9ACTN|nr:hypothetical protein [Micromonospora nigra]SCL32990.1 hypothetical protein GA0070616_4607 [Micromonospora nigra]
MAFDPVPWFIGGGAEHSPEVARMIAYSAFRGNEGVMAAGDLAVKALDVPGTSVRVMPGACAINSRAVGGAYQAYGGRAPSESLVEIGSTGSGAGRSDLIVARVEDPFMPGEPWSEPPDVTAGPYIFPRVISGVPAGTTTVDALGLGYSAIALARIDLPASTGTVTQAMITDLRRVANPRRERRLIVSSPASNHDIALSTFADWPSAAVKPVTVPTWATQVRIVQTIAGCLAFWDKVNGETRVRLGTLYGQPTLYDTNSVVGGDALDKTMVTADTLAVPSAMRGTTQDVALQARTTYRGATGTAILRATVATTIVTDIEFVEVPE